MELIENIIATLEQVEVKGSSNMDKLLGCIQALRTILSEQEKKDGKQEDR